MSLWDLGEIHIKFVLSVWAEIIVPSAMDLVNIYERLMGGVVSIVYRILQNVSIVGPRCKGTDITE